jgi:cysteinyl-tRNA synthetase
MLGGYTVEPLPDPVEVERLWNARKKARMARDFALADQLKRELEELGINVNMRDRIEAGPLRHYQLHA